MAAFGHRVVHGGLDYDSPVRLAEAVLNDLMKLSPLAPLHQPHNILNVAPHDCTGRVLRHGLIFACAGCGLDTHHVGA